PWSTPCRRRHARAIATETASSKSTSSSPRSPSRWVARPLRRAGLWILMSTARPGSMRSSPRSTTPCTAAAEPPLDLPRLAAEKLKRRLEQSFELELPLRDLAVQKPVALQHLVIVRTAGDVRARSARSARHEADPLESVFQARAGEDRRAMQRLGHDARGVV